MHCSGQETHGTDRQPAVAGSFYPADPGKLSQMLAGFFALAVRQTGAGRPAPVALVAPHAGYVFSGQTDAWSYVQLDPEKTYHTIFIIGTSHYVHFNGASIYNKGNYVTPLGKVPVDFDIAGQLMTSSNVFSYEPSAHQREHSIEVQLPFLQYRLRHPFKIVPILLGTQDPGVISTVAKALGPYKTEDNLFILSTDFSHYPLVYACRNHRQPDHAVFSHARSGTLPEICHPD